MNRILRYIIIGTCASLMLVIAGCSDDTAEGTGQTRSHELRMTLGTHPYITRGTGDMPAGFEFYDHTTAPTKIMQIQGYMTFWESDATTPAWNVVPTAFTHEETDIWTSKVALKTLGTGASYYLYGYLPKESVTGSVTIAPKGDATQANGYAQGAVMTFNNLDAILPKDICVFVGVKGYGKGEGNIGIPDMSSRLGVFSYNPDNEGDNIFLLVEHLYAGMKFNFRLDADYSKLRKIKVKKVRLIPKGATVVDKVRITVTIAANGDGRDPIAAAVGGSVDYTSTSNTSATPVSIFDDEQLLTTTYQPFFGYICPADNTSGNKTFTLETTYDVYDTDDNLIREDETALNAITLTGDMAAGQMHIVNITVQPTYLYVLSDPDLDNPTFQISSE